MRRLQLISTEHGARKLMQRLVDVRGCTVEDFDSPPPGHINPQAYRNLLRDPVDDADPKVEVVNPRDFVPAEENALPY
jgi:hypothetical protein